jgi:hypothetical protein
MSEYALETARFGYSVIWVETARTYIARSGPAITSGEPFLVPGLRDLGSLDE